MEYIAGGYAEQGEVVPTSQGLAIYLDVCRMTPYNWAHQENNPFREEFEYINDRVQAIQGMKLVSGGLSGEMNPSFAGKLVGNHGFSDKHSLEHSGPNGDPIKTESKVEWVIQPVKPVDQVDDEADA